MSNSQFMTVMLINLGMFLAPCLIAWGYASKHHWDVPEEV